MAWTKLVYSKSAVDRCGKLLAEPSALDDPRHVLEVVNNWRSSHSLPLYSVKMTLLKRARKIDSTALVAQRLKRLPSIEEKLRTEPTMKLSQMQDLGGCRAVMLNIPELLKLEKVYDAADGPIDRTSDNNRNRPQLVEKYDYISSPKPDGYRGFHRVYKYYTKLPQYETFNGRRIEVQLRTALQHAWATAVETVITFTGIPLRRKDCQSPWKRFFALMGTAIASRESCQPVPGTPESKQELVAELRTLETALKAQATLSGFRVAMQTLPKKKQTDAVAFVLVLNMETRYLNIQSFTKGQRKAAFDKYAQLETEIAGAKRNAQAVLVEVDSLDALRRAYPNYFVDTSAFIKAIQKAIS
jgi:ppGpp synthetase/RelA/SpoT-type nucleotidyltranferase